MGAVGIGCRENKGAAKHLTILNSPNNYEFSRSNVSTAVFEESWYKSRFGTDLSK